MLDLKFIRANLDAVRAGAKAKGESVDLDRFEALDVRRREIVQKVEALKQERNIVSRSIGELKRTGENADEPAAKAKKLGEDIKVLDAELKTIDEEVDTLRTWIPNMPHESVPIGDESSNELVRQWGETKAAASDETHYEIAERLGLVDFGGASDLSGAGFAVFTGQGARLRRALIQFMLDAHTKENGFREVSTPYAVRPHALFGTGQIPKLEDDMYRMRDDELYLIPTAEVSITNIFGERTFASGDLPVNLVGYSPCFRREAGTYGKDTRGLQRLHQFDKVEMVKMVEPESSYEELERLLGHAEELLKRLELPYRVLVLASGDLSFAAAKCYDLEVWAPGEQKWLEVSSVSNFESFQARRIGLRVKHADRKGSDYLHTLNGSGLALPRVIIGLLENHLAADGTVRIPDALVPYMDGLTQLG